MRALSSTTKKKGPPIRAEAAEAAKAAEADRSKGAVGVARTVRNLLETTSSALTFDLERIKCKTYLERSAIEEVQQITADQ